MLPVAAALLGLALTGCEAIPGNALPSTPRHRRSGVADGGTVTPSSLAPASTQPVTGQDRLEAEALVIDVREGPTLRKAQWTLTPGLNPDIYTVALGKGERREVCFISGARSLCRTVGVGEQHDFIISHAGVDYPTRIVGEYVPPMAVFDEAYQAAHRGKVRVSIPEVYELVNIAIALTPTARDQSLVARNTPYYDEAAGHFAGVSEHPFVLALDQELRRGRYAPIKMNAYAFEFGERDRIVRSRVYDRTGFSQSTSNDLLPWLAPMQDFADQSGFRAFYAEHRPLYESQIEYLRRGLDIDAMLAWLRANFPDVKPYDTVNIIFSPLVGASQSVTWMESNGFSELQPHVNFPYGPSSGGTRSPEAIALRRGWIVFTELNHGFINPTADPFADRITMALRDRAQWVVDNANTAGYPSPLSVFNEMMNWGLISLYLVDKAPQAERESLQEDLDRVMSERRGFKQSPRFHRFLVEIYSNRPPGATVAGLYPSIVEWFEAEAGPRPEP